MYEFMFLYSLIFKNYLLWKEVKVELVFKIYVLDEL